MNPKSMDELYYDELRDLYDAEHRIIKALPKMAKKASSPQLNQAFTEHLQQSQGHVRRLDQIFSSLGKKPSAKTCDGIKGILEEGSDVFDFDEGAIRDAALIGGAQRVEHYEMAAYGAMRTWAQQLGRTQDVQLLDETLGEEKMADQKLTQIAESGVNQMASGSSENRGFSGMSRTPTPRSSEEEVTAR